MPPTISRTGSPGTTRSSVKMMKENILQVVARKTADRDAPRVRRSAPDQASVALVMSC